MNEKVKKLFEKEDDTKQDQTPEEKWDKKMRKLFKDWLNQKNFVEEEYNMITDYA